MRGRRWVALLALCASGTALAVKPGGTLYVKARNTRLMASASPTADAVAILQPGQEVKWLGADPRNKQWHRVEAGGKKGLVFQSNLSPKPPNMELLTQGDSKKVDATAFANSGAAVKGLSKGAIAYGKKKGTDFSHAAAQLEELEKLAEKIGPAEMAEHARKSRLFPVVGPKETAKRGAR